MSRPLSLFAKPQEDQNSRIMRNLLALHEKEHNDERPLSQRDEPEQNVAAPKRPTSANPLKRRLKSGNPKSKSNTHEATKGSVNSNANNLLDDRNLNSREDLIAEIQDLKKRNLSLEDHIAILKSENQRLDSEAVKQQRRIDQLLNLSEGVKSAGNSTNLRKEIEKSILVRQLKSQLNIMKNVIVDKENEIDLLKRDMRVSKLKEMENERDEYFHEIQRLLKVIENLKGELSRERRRREWNCKLAGETGDDLRKEIARLASGYQNILTNLSSKGTPSHALNGAGNNKFAVYTGNGNGGVVRPSTAGASRSSSNNNANNSFDPATNDGKAKQRPQSANIRGSKGANNNTKPAPAVATNFSPIGGPAGNNDNMSPIGSPTERWIENFNTENFNNNQNDLLRLQQNNQSPDAVQQQQGAPQGRPLSDFYPKTSSKNNQEEDEDEDGEEELPSERIPITHPHDSFQDNPKLHQYHTIDEKELALHHAQHHQQQLHHPFQQPFPQQQQQPPPQQFHQQLQQHPPQQKPFINHIMSNASMNSTPVENPFEQGDKVQAEYRGKGRWYDGIVESYDKESNSYTIKYDDGDEEKGVLPARVRLISKKLPEAKYVHGNKVEALYYSGKSWYKGEVKGPPVYMDAKQSYVYEIVYNDGEREKQVLEQNIRLIGGVESTPVPSSSSAKSTASPVPPASPNKNTNSNTSPRSPVKTATTIPSSVAVAKFTKNEAVEGMYAGNNQWYKATVTAVLEDAGGFLYDLLYEDGDIEKGLPETRLRKLPASLPAKEIEDEGEPKKATPQQPPATAPSSSKPQQQQQSINEPPVNDDPHTSHLTPVYKINDIVEAYFADYSQWFRGKILQISFHPETSDILYHIRYDDGDEEKDVPGNRLRYFKKFQGKVVFQYQLNEAIEARYHSGKDFYSGKIIKCHEDEDYGPVYDVLYDDGDQEKNIKEYNIRSLSSNSKKAPAPAISSSPAVQANPNPTSSHQQPAESSPPNASNMKKSSSNADNNHHVVTTNLDSFLNELSDDEEDDGDNPFNAGLDSGKHVQLKNTKQGAVIQETLDDDENNNNDNEYNEDDFDA